MDAILRPDDPKGDHDLQDSQNPLSQRSPLPGMPLGIGRRSKDPVRVNEVPTLLLKERILFIPPIINDQMANLMIGFLLYLESQDSSKDIHMYINCHGSLDGNFYYGLGIYDTMQVLKPDIATYCVGIAGGVAAALLAGGTKGKRYCLPHSQVILHQPYSGVRGQASDIDILAREIIRQRSLFHDILAKHTGHDIEDIRKDADRRQYLTAEAALEYGLVDEIITQE